MSLPSVASSSHETRQGNLATYLSELDKSFGVEAPCKAHTCPRGPVAVYLEVLKESIDIHPALIRRHHSGVPQLPKLVHKVSTSHPAKASTSERLPRTKTKKPKKLKPHEKVSSALLGEMTAVDEAVDDDLNEEVAAAGRDFDKRHSKLNAHAKEVLQFAGHRRLDNPDAEAGFQHALDNLRRNRFFVDEHLLTAVRIGAKNVQPRRKARVKFRLEDSCWAPRLHNGLLETEECLRSLFLSDWDLARRSHGLEKFIIKNDDRSDMPTSKLDADGDGTYDEVEEVCDTLWRHCRILYGAFEYYAALYSEEGTHDMDIFNMSMNSFYSFASQCKIPSADCPMRDIETIWVLVNANEMDTAVRAEDKHNSKTTLNRQEFLQCIVRIAIKKYCQSGKIADVSQAVDQLCSSISGRLPIEALQNSNVFRARYCYIEQTAEVLKHATSSIKSLYDRYAEVIQDGSNVLSSSNAMSIGEWLTFVDHIGFFDYRLLTHFEAKLVFLWSRVRAMSDRSNRSEMRLRHLQLKDFMEALVRLSVMVALPTDEDIDQMGFSDAATYVQTMQEDSAQWDNMLAERAQKWHREPRQKVWRCAHHLLNIIIHLVEDNSSRQLCGAADGIVTADEAQSFVKRRMGGRKLDRQQSVKMGLDQLQSALEAVKARVLESLRKVAAFEKLTEEHLLLLRNAMTEAPFEKDDYIIEQGDIGDMFYVIISGTAVVTRDANDPNEPEQELARLGEGATFGERALLKSEPRFANIQATSKLKTMCISKEGFERALGATLHELIEDKY